MEKNDLTDFKIFNFFTKVFSSNVDWSDYVVKQP